MGQYREISVNQKQSIGAAALLGLVALLIAGTLLIIGREDHPQEQTFFTPKTYDGPAMLRLTETLSSDALGGRATGTDGNAAARGFILKRFETLGLEAFGDGYAHSFPILPNPGSAGTAMQGVNLIGWIRGDTPGVGPVIVITAHYDHVGTRDGQVYNGADDNASGSAALIALAEHFTRSPPRHDIIIAALDAEEIGLLGARDFIRDTLVPQDRVALNINMDMVSRSEAAELYVAGTYHTPALKPYIAAVAETAPATLLMGHDKPEDGANDWTLQSDHGPFHEIGIPFLYFGVEDHAGYHQPSDDYENITLDFFLRSVATIISVAEAVDEALDDIARSSQGQTPNTMETSE